jgi:O-antigen/teichoic acid export membrane protein
MYHWNDIKIQIKGISGKGFFNLLTANVFIQIISFGAQLFVAGILSPEDIGRIKILQTFLAIFTIFGSMGFNSSTLKLCSEHRTEEEKKQIFRAGIFFTAISTLSAYLIVILLNSIGLLSQDSSIRTLIPLALFPLISSAFFSLYIGYHQAQKKIKLISNLTFINKLLSLFLIIIFTSYFGIQGYYMAYNISFIVLLITIYIITKKISGNNKVHLSKKLFNLHWNYARPSFYSNILATLSSYVDILLISFMVKDIQEIGYYSFALTLTIIFKLLPSTVQQISIPYFSNFASSQKQILYTYNRYSKILIFIIVLTCIVALLIAPFLIDLIFKGKYNSSIPYFIPLAIGWSILQFNQIQAAALFGIGKMNQIAKSQFILLFFNTIIMFIAIKAWGLTGASYASIVCAVFIVSLLRFYFRQSIKS